MTAATTTALPPSTLRRNSAANSLDRIRLLHSMFSVDTLKRSGGGSLRRLNNLDDDDAVLLVEESEVTTHSTETDNGSSSELFTLTTAQPQKKRVSFSRTGNEPLMEQSPQVTIIETLPPLKDRQDLYWTPQELEATMSREEGIVAEALLSDPHLIFCLDYCYGLTYVDYDASPTGRWTTDKSLRYFYGYQNGTLRGLESLLSTRIVQHRQQCIQATLELQARIRRQQQSPLQWPSPMLKALRTQSARASLQSRNYARLLAQQDAEAVCR